jgi:hypothetical protein
VTVVSSRRETYLEFAEWLDSRFTSRGGEVLGGQIADPVIPIEIAMNFVASRAFQNLGALVFGDHAPRIITWLTLSPLD